MKHPSRRLFALAAALVLALSLSACGSKGAEPTAFDAKLYMDGLFKKLYLGQFEQDYLDLFGIDQQQAEADYESSLQQEANYFIQRYGVEYPDDEYFDAVTELYRQVYQHTSYEIVSAAQQEDGSWSVKLTVEPIDIVHLVCEDEDTADAIKAFAEKYPTDVLNGLDDEEYEEVDGEYADLILKLFQDQLPETGNLAPVSLTVQLEKNADGLYAITSKDFTALNEAVLDYDAELPAVTNGE